jgi:GxxExxY protein
LESFRFFVRVSSWIAFFQSSDIKQGMTDLILKDEVYQIVGGAMDVYAGQLINYLKVTHMHLGLLINFSSHPKLEWKRYVI